MEKKLLQRIEGMEDTEREKLHELLKDSKQAYVLVCLFLHLAVNTVCYTMLQLLHIMEELAAALENGGQINSLC